MQLFKLKNANLFWSICNKFAISIDKLECIYLKYPRIVKDVII